MTAKLSTTLRAAAGLILATLLILFTLRSSGGNPWSHVRQARHDLLLLAVMLYGTILMLGMYRWSLLLRVQGVRLRAAEIFRLWMIGIFFNLIIPGATSGDLVKMAFVTRRVGGKKTEAVVTIVLDRFIGLLGLFAIAAVMVLLYLRFLLQLPPSFLPIKLAAGLVALGGLGGALVLALAGIRGGMPSVSRLAPVVDRVMGRLPGFLRTTIERIRAALILYRGHPRTIATALALSVVTHAGLALCVFLIGIAVDEQRLGFGDYLLAVPVSNAVAVIPITPGGLGTRDATMAMFLRSMNATPGKPGLVPVLLSAVLVFWGLVGGLMLATGKDTLIGNGPARE